VERECDGGFKLGGEGGEAGEEVGAEQLEDAGDGDEDGDAFAADEVDDSTGFELVGEMDLSGEKRWKPKAHELSEDVAEGNGVEEAEGMEDALVFEILLHLALDGEGAGKDVGVGVDDAFGLGGGAGGEDDLERGFCGDGGADGEVGGWREQFVELA
jgi:hypothetical protein